MNRRGPARDDEPGPFRWELYSLNVWSLLWSYKDVMQ